MSTETSENCFFCLSHGNPLDPTDFRMAKCTKCGLQAHPFCVYKHVIPSFLLNTEWECSNCKSCTLCGQSIPEDPDLVLCDACDRGFHPYCFKPPLKEAPKETWFCESCMLMKQQISCTTPGCDGTGHINRRSKTHSYDKMCPYARLLRRFEREQNNPKKLAKKLKLSLDEDMGDESVARIPSKKVKKIIVIPDDEEEDADLMDKDAIAHKFFKNKLSAEDSKISRTFPDSKDVALFEKSREDGLKMAPKEQKITPYPMGDREEELIPRIKHIVIGNHKIDTWYLSPYPEEYNLLSTVFLCKFCLKYIKSEMTFKKHCAKCPHRHPPGDEIYRDGNLSIFEVDGRKNKIYCQNLCLLAKMFLDHKTLYYDVEPFLFYVLTELDSEGCNFVGYFSKEKRSSMNYNLSCIVTLPCFQGRGFGQLLIDFSYLLSIKEGKPGTPEKPLSDLGLFTYRAYWRIRILEELVLATRNSRSSARISFNEISEVLGITVDDVVTTLQDLNMLKRDSSGELVVALDMQKANQILTKNREKNYPRAKSEYLRWTPFVLGSRMNNI